MKEIILTDAAPAPIGPYSQAVKAGNFLFVSGQIPIKPATGLYTPEDVATETEQVMKNLEAILSTAGGSFEHVVKTSIFLSDMNDFPIVNNIYGQYFGAHAPARETVQVAALPKGVKVEISCIAVIR
ncbi:MAG: RidA family protein [Flavobacteriales bacterium]|nr:RidA family protein [Flavobacteriales bacterium]